MKSIKSNNQDQLTKQVIKLLDTPFWPQQLDINKDYFRTHDDCDGDLYKGITVGFTQDGDAWINTYKQGCRFRTYHGGGKSLRIRNALLFLALAIQLDNKEFPI